MKKMSVLTREQVSPANQGYFDSLQKMAGFVPNLYSVLAHSGTALGTYLALQSAKSSIRTKEREVVNLVVSQVNNCRYCLSAHTAFAKMNGFTDEQVLAIRRADIPFDAKLDALARLVKSITSNRGHAGSRELDNFFAAGYTEENLADVVINIGDKIITNYLFALSDIPIDWPLAPELETVEA